MSFGETWAGDWRKRIAVLLDARGYGDVRELFDRAPDATPLQLASILGENVAAVQLVQLYLDTPSPDELERRAKDLLVRELRANLPEGWHATWDDDARARRGRAIGKWSGAIATWRPDAGDAAFRVLLALRDSTELPEGWLPATPDDPILSRLFERTWRAPQ